MQDGKRTMLQLIRSGHTGGMPNHNTDNCYKLQKDVKNVERIKNESKMNKVDDHSDSEDDCAHLSKN